jgi:GAF domain-containing protein
MPYLRCTTCGALSYAPRNGLGMSCPACGVPVTRPGEVAGDPGDPGRRLDHLLRLTRDLLDTDVALLTEIADGREIIRRFDGDWAAGGVFQDASASLEDTFCQRMLDGRIGNYIRDAQANDQVSELAMVRELGIRAWLGVPIRLSDMHLYMLCCLASEARPSIGEREVRLLAGLAESVRAELSARGAVAGS